MRTSALLLGALLTVLACAARAQSGTDAAPAAPAAAPAAGAEPAAEGFGHDWESWRAGNSVADLASLQRGARNFMAYCRGCHSLKYVRYSRMAQDLEIEPALAQKYLLPPSGKLSDYVTAPMPRTDAESWFGKAPPDLSLMARARGVNYIYQLLTTFYVDPARPTGANNLRLDAIAMPDVLSDLEGLKRAVFKDERVGSGNTATTQHVFDHFEPIAAGQLSREQYEQFVRDTVNFLDYVGEPAQLHRRALGVWVVLFLLVFSWVAWLLKKDYWKDVH
jgi:ubiquinol-cytochrome c reductase cytochrome c1 subunit